MLQLTPPSTRNASMNPLPAVDADVNYLGPTQGPPQTCIYPPSSGIATVRPPQERHRVSISDARPIALELRLDNHGFAVHSCHRTSPIFTTTTQFAIATIRRCGLSCSSSWVPS